MKAEHIVADIHPLRAAAVRAIGGTGFRRFRDLADKVDDMTRGAKMPEGSPGYVSLSQDPLFEIVMDDNSDDRGADAVFLSPLGREVLNCLSTAPADKETEVRE